MEVKIRHITHYNDSIRAFELVSMDGQRLPLFEAGAHIDVHLDNGLTRQYSLVNYQDEASHYLIGVLNDSQSRGGSKHIHENFHVGQVLTIGEPRNLFSVDPSTKKAILCAGGIGITPMIAIAQELTKKAIPFELHYFAQRRNLLSFMDILESFGSKVILHIDDEPDSLFQADKVFKNFSSDTHLYLCGPQGFMDYITNSAIQLHWQTQNIHKESFTAVIDNAENQAFTLKIHKTGQTMEVPADKTVAQVLEEHGIFVPLSCEQGICGTCLTTVVSGEVDHKDQYLTEEEQAQNNQFTPCCSRAKSKILEIDI